MEPLMNIIGDEPPTKKLRKVEVTHRSGKSEMQVRARISQYLDCTIDVFCRNFNNWLQTTKMGNHCFMWTSYKLIRIGNEAQIWHLSAKGEMDRLVCTVHQDQEPTPVYIWVDRVQMYDSEPMRLDVNHIVNVNPATRDDRAIVCLHANHRVEVRGSVDEINQQIEAAKANPQAENS